MATCPSMPKPAPSCQECPPAGQCRCAVDLATGAPEVGKTYLQTEHGEISLRWFNQYDYSGSLDNPNRGLGTNWFSPSLGYVVIDEGCASVVLMPGRGGETLYFMGNSQDGYTPAYCAREQFDYVLTDPIDGVRADKVYRYRLANEDGTLSYFRESDHRLERRVPPGRIGETKFVYEGSLLRQQRREYLSSEGDTVELRYFEYNADDWISSITLQRHTIPTAQPGDGGWTLIRRLVLEYYQDTDAYGNRGDLKSVTEQIPDPEVPGQWIDGKIDYYRYYKPGESGGYEHGLKYVVSPQGTELLKTYETATNEEVARHAAQYFKYDEQSRRVTWVSTSGGEDTFEISYSENESLSFVDYNHWTLKAELTTEDGALKTVYSNHIAQDLLVDLRKEANDPDSVHWVTYRKYDGNGRVIESHSPTSVISYDETKDDLGVVPNPSAGMIRMYAYFGETDPATGKADGYLASESIQCVKDGTAVTIREYEYHEHKEADPDIESGDGWIKVYRVSRETVFHTDDPTSATPTTFQYSYFPGTSQLVRVTRELVPVPPSMNGVNYPQFDTTIEEYDQLGRLAGEVDGANVRTEYTYEVHTSARKTMTQDAGPVGLNLNLVTDYEVDELGRVTAELGPVHHAGQDGASIRSSRRTRYLDDKNTVWTWRGYQTVEAVPVDVVINPVSITVLNKDDQVVDELSSRQGTEREYVGAPDQSVADQTSWLRWTRNLYRLADSEPLTGRLLATRVYHNIPDSGEGDPGTNYDETQYQYDAMGRRDYVRTPGGTITKLTYDPRDLVMEEQVGTDLANLRVVRANLYDQDAYSDQSDSKDGLLVSVMEPVDDMESNDRVTKYRYDCRNRRTTVLRDNDTLRDETQYNNLDLPTVQTSYHVPQAGGQVLLSLSENHYDTRSRLYRISRHGVDDSGGETGVVIEDNRWYDGRDSVIKSIVDGVGEFSKFSYDALGRQQAAYYAYYSGSGTDDLDSVSNDIVLEQTVNRYDDGLNPGSPGKDTGDVTFVTRYRRAPSDMITRGALDRTDEPPAPSRITYTGLWYDEIGRVIARGRFGTHGGTQPDRDAAPPRESTDTELVELRTYGQDGQLQFEIDEKQQVTQTNYDDAGRVVKVTRNEFTAEYEQLWLTYNADGNVLTVRARNTTTGYQTTQYVYGVNTDPPNDVDNESGGSAINSTQLLFKVIYPEQDATSEHLHYRYNRQGEPVIKGDQNKTEHAYAYDKLGRLIEDRVSVGSGVDATVQRINRSYDNRRRLSQVASWGESDASPLNEVKYEYNAFDQVSRELQSHAGSAGVGSPGVSYVHDSDDPVTSGSTLRRTKMIYPSSRVLKYQYDQYGPAGNEREMSRVSGLEWDRRDVAAYSYSGWSNLTAVTYLTSNGSVSYRLLDDSGIGNDDALDRFDRVERSAWVVNGGKAEVDIHYGYDYASNRTYRRDERARSDATEQDEKYSYDGLHRLIDFQRGVLSADNTAILNANLEQDWDLDQTGNWNVFNQRIQAPLAQTRTHKLDNQIATINTWDDPEHDANGNMTFMPRGNDPSLTFKAIYDAWNRLVRVEDGASSAVVASYEHDGLNRRIVKRTTETRHYYYSDQWQVVEEDVEQSQRQELASAQYVWGLRYIDDLIVYDRIGEGQRLFGLQDANWNVVALLDDAGAVQERYLYEPYGKVEFQDADFVSRPAGSALANPYTYTGRRLDDDTGLYYYRNRYYHAQLGRFLSRDPIGYGAGDANLYQYVAGRPTVLTDPTGEIYPVLVGAAAVAWWLLRPTVANAPSPTDTTAYEHQYNQANAHTAIGILTLPVGAAAYRGVASCGGNVLVRVTCGGGSAGVGQQLASDILREPIDPGTGISSYFSNPQGTLVNYGTSMAAWTVFGLAGEGIQAFRPGSLYSVRSTPPELFSYTYEPVVGPRFTSSTGRCYFTSVRPGSWLTDKCCSAYLKRLLVTGHSSPYPSQQSYFTTGTADPTSLGFQPIRPGPVNFWKPWGGQYHTPIGTSGFTVRAGTNVVIRPIIPSTTMQTGQAVIGTGVETIPYVVLPGGAGAVIYLNPAGTE